jgi:hypothetical protein
MCPPVVLLRTSYDAEAPTNPRIRYQGLVVPLNPIVDAPDCGVFTRHASDGTAQRALACILPFPEWHDSDWDATTKIVTQRRATFES